jgi:hypothetical protein
MMVMVVGLARMLMLFKLFLNVNRLLRSSVLHRYISTVRFAVNDYNKSGAS